MSASANRPARHASSLPARRSKRPSGRGLALLSIGSIGGALVALRCDTPHTFVVFDNQYPASTRDAAVVYQAAWQAITLPAPLPPGDSSDPVTTIAASENTAYAVLAPGWDPDAGTSPTTFVVLQSRSGFAVHLNNTLHIPIDDATFAGNCAGGSTLSQEQADVITRLVFPLVFQSLRYDAATCTTTPIGDAGAH